VCRVKRPDFTSGRSYKIRYLKSRLGRDAIENLGLLVRCALLFLLGSGEARRDEAGLLVRSALLFLLGGGEVRRDEAGLLIRRALLFLLRGREVSCVKAGLLSVEFFFFFLADSSSLLTMPLTAGVANAGRLTEVRKPSATAIAVILRIVFTLFGSIHFWRELTTCAVLASSFSLPCVL
jgi:hypothetical protein